MWKTPAGLRGAVLGAGLMVSCVVGVAGSAAFSQAPAGPPAAAGRQIGTVVSLGGNSLVLRSDAGQQVSVSVPDGARILQLAPGSTNLKEAQAITLADIAMGDRILVTGKPGSDAGSFEALRVILMKSGDIAQKHAMEQADWQKRGIGGIVSTVDAATGAMTVTEGAKKITVNTSSKTEFRRYAGDSVKFEDARPGTLAQIHAGDQLRVRGTNSADGSSINAEEVVSGSFKHLAGAIATIDAANGTLTLKDLATKRVVTVKLTENSSIRALPPQVATRFATRARGGAAKGGEAHAEDQHGGQGAGQRAGQGAGEDAAGQERAAGMDLSQVVSRLPNGMFADLKVGEEVMIVASQSDPGSSSETAVTLLSGVEPILAATPSGAPAMTLSPWSMGGGSAESGAQ